MERSNVKEKARVVLQGAFGSWSSWIVFEVKRLPCGFIHAWNEEDRWAFRSTSALHTVLFIANYKWT
jgi:hypothetical protein